MLLFEFGAAFASGWAVTVSLRTQTSLATKAPTVLLIEDAGPTRLLMKGILQGAGFHVLEAPLLKQASRMVVSHPPQILVVDDQLPDGSGLDFLSRLRHEGFAGPVVLLPSLFTDRSRLDRLRVELGISAVIEKPFSATRFLTSVFDALNPN